jgi:hypothetical protein
MSGTEWAVMPKTVNSVYSAPNQGAAFGSPFYLRLLQMPRPSHLRARDK